MRKFSILIPIFGLSCVVAMLCAAVTGSAEAKDRYAFAGYVTGLAAVGCIGIGIAASTWEEDKE